MHRLLIAALLLPLLAACAGQQPRQQYPDDWDQQYATIQQLAHWEASGKIALRNAGSSESASLRWRQSGSDTELELSGPMGLSATRIHSDGSRLDVSQGSEQQTIDISTPEALYRATGWELPLQALPYWLKGIPAPSLPVTEQRLAAGLLVHLAQAGWQIDYADYGQFDALHLPTRLTFSRGATRGQLILRQWTVESPE